MGKVIKLTTDQKKVFDGFKLTQPDLYAKINQFLDRYSR